VVNHSVGGIIKFLNFVKILIILFNESQALCFTKLLKEVCQNWVLKAKLVFGVSQLLLKANSEKAFLWAITCND
jgi:hypothetical protein